MEIAHPARPHPGTTTPTMLTSQLRELEADGLIKRKIFATVPPTVEYSLTAFGQTVTPMMEEIKKWGLAHRNRPRTRVPQE
jgi:DNA-binding HxlR family transcriptional regulator